MLELSESYQKVHLSGNVHERIRHFLDTLSQKYEFAKFISLTPCYYLPYTKGPFQ